MEAVTEDATPRPETDDAMAPSRRSSRPLRPSAAEAVSALHPSSPSRGPRRRSRRALSAAALPNKSSADDGYTTTLDGRMTPIEQVHRTLEAPPAAAAKSSAPAEVVAAGADLLPRDEGRLEEDEGLDHGPATKKPYAAPSAVRRRRRRITRRLASPRSVLVQGSAHYLISPWTTDLDGDDADDEEERRYSAKASRDKASSGGGRPASCPMDEVLASKREENFEGDVVRGGKNGLRRRRRSRRSTKANVETPSVSSLNSESAAAAAKKAEREKIEVAKTALSFTAFRMTYLLVHIAIMLADGLQGTHLYVLYEGYGYSVASLYSLGFVSGAFTSPFIGPFVDKIGRKKSAILYCALEVFINLLEQYPLFAGLIVSRVVGGITTNLLFSVFESWLVTEHRRRGYAEEKLETILRDSVIASNLAAIASGWLAHFLASRFGPVGPFEGAVACTSAALVLVAVFFTENYGCSTPGVEKSLQQYMTGALRTIASDSNISRIGLIQGFSEGALQTFVFLWSPALRHFSTYAPKNALGLDADGQPAYGLIFGAFMACGVFGGLSEPYVRRAITCLVRDRDRRAGLSRRDTVVFKTDGADPSSDSEADSDGGEEVKPAAVEFLTSVVYFVSACLLLTPFLLPEDSPYSFSIALVSFLLYEFMIGLYMPCEGVIRSIYMPTASICSLMTMLRVIVNVCVALGVVSTNFVPFATAFAVIAGLMFVSALVQLSLVSPREWSNFVGRIGPSGRESFRLAHPFLSSLGSLASLSSSSSASSDSSVPSMSPSPASTPTKKPKHLTVNEDDGNPVGPPPPLSYSPGSALSHVEESSDPSSSEEEDNVEL